MNNYTNATLLDARYYSNIFETDPPPQVYINGQAYNLDSTDVTAGGQNYTDTLHYSGSVGYVEIQRNATSNSTMASYMWGTAPNGETFTTSYDPDSWQIGALPADLAISFNAISGTPANGPPYVSWAGNLLHFYYTTGDGKDLYWAPGDAGGDYSVIVGSDDSVTATHGGTETAGTYLPASSTFTNVAGNAPISDNFFALGSDGNPVGLPSGVTVLVYGRGFGNSVLLPDGIHTGGYTYQRPDGSWGRKYVGLPANNMFVISDDAGNYNSQLYITQDGESINAVSGWPLANSFPAQVYVNGMLCPLHWETNYDGGMGQNTYGGASYISAAGDITLTLGWAWDDGAIWSWSMGSASGAWDYADTFSNRPSGTSIHLTPPPTAPSYGPARLVWNGTELTFKGLASQDAGADVYEGAGTRLAVGPNGAATVTDISSGNVLYSGYYNGTSKAFSFGFANFGTVSAEDGAGNVLATSTPGFIGSDWTYGDVGIASAPGNSSYDAGSATYTVRGAGTGIGGTADAFQGMMGTLTGDGQIVARVVTQSSTGAYASAGVMIRDSAAPGARNVFLAAAPSGGLFLQSRAVVNEASLSSSTAGAVPTWLKLVRQGTSFSGYYSADGVTWTLLSTVNAPVPYDAAVGLAVTSGDGATLNTVTFDNVQVTSVEDPAGLSGSYFQGSTLATLRTVRRDGAINFNWAGSPPDVSVDPGDYSVRWKGDLLAGSSEKFTFYTQTDDKVRLWVNDQLLIDNWTTHSLTEDQSSITLVAGNLYHVRMEYGRTTGSGVAVLLWSTPALAKQVIPSSAFSNDDIDGDGMPDAWEIAHGLNPRFAGDANMDLDGDGISNLLEYLNGTDPTDYYNGVPPTAQIADGNNQSGMVNTLFAQPLRVFVTSNGVPMSNAPVTFQVTTGGGLLADSGGSNAVASYVTRTNAQGYASAYFQGASQAGTASISATAGAAPQLNFVVSTLAAGQSPLPTAGMLIWLKADFGVTSDINGKVSAWADESGTGHSAVQTTAASSPLFVNSPGSLLNGWPVLRFDGSSSYLSIPSAITDFSGGITAFMVVKPTASGSRTYERYFDFGNGAPGNNILLCRGTNTTDMIYESLTGFSYNNATTLTAPSVLVQNQFQILTAAQSSSTAYIFQNGVQLATGTAFAIPSAARTSNYIGKSNWNDPLFQGDMAEVLIYNRLLSVAERKAVEAYLNQKYAIAAAPTAITGLVANAASGSQIDLTWTPSTGASQVLVERKTSGGSYASVASLSGGASAFCDQNLTPGTSYTYRVTASQMGLAALPSNEANATTNASGIVSVPSDHLMIWLKAGAGVTQGTGSTVQHWSDVSGNGNDAVQTIGAAYPTAVTGALNGQPVVRFDGTSSYLKIPTSLTDFTAGVTAFVVAKPTSAANYARFFDFGVGQASSNILLCRNGTSNDLLFDTFTGGGASVQLAGPGVLTTGVFQLLAASQGTTSAAVYKNGVKVGSAAAPALQAIARATNYIGKSNWGATDPLYAGDMAEILIYNRALSDAERQQVEAYLNQKYLLVSAPTAVTNLAANPASGSQIDLTWSASTGANQLLIERKVTGSGTYAALTTLPGSAMAYCDQGLAPGTSYTYRVTASQMGLAALPSNEASATTNASGIVSVPTNSLSFWFKAGAGVVPDASQKVQSWLNFGANGGSATQVTAGSRPSIVSNAFPNGQPSLQFNGSNFLQGGPSGFSGNKLTIFAVTKGTNYQSLVRLQQSGYIVYPWSSSQNTQTNQVFIVSNDGGTGNGVNTGLVANQWNIGAAIFDGGNQMSCFNNGLLVAQRVAGAANLPSDSLMLGAYNGNAEFLNAQVAEVLIYNRALSSTEREAVETYLNLKYQTVAAPAAPTGLTATPISTGEMDLSWTAVTGANQYVIQRMAAGDSQYATIATVAEGTTYTDRGLSANTSYSYRIVGAGIGGQSTASSATSGTTLSTGDPMPLAAAVLWLRADEGVVTDANGKVVTWLDQSGYQNDAFQNSAGNRPAWTTTSASLLNGHPLVTFGGSASLNLPNFTSSLGAGELFTVHRSALNQSSTSSVGWHHFGTGGSAYYPYSGVIYDDFGTDTRQTLGAPLVATDSYHLYDALSQPNEWTARQNGRLYYTTNVNNVKFATNPQLGLNYSYFQGDVAEILMFNRALTPDERHAVEGYFTRKFALAQAPVGAPTTLAARAISVSQVNLLWTPVAGVFTEYVIERKTGSDGTYAIVSTAPSTASSYLDSGLVPNTQYFYRVRTRTFGGTSDPSTEVACTTQAAGPALPFAKLVMWLDSDFGITSDGNGFVTRWSDVSGNGNDGTQSVSGSQPIVVSNALGTHSAVRFDGTASYLRLGNNFNDFSAGISAYVIVKPTASTTPLPTNERFFDIGIAAAVDNIVLGRNGTSADLVFNEWYAGTAADGYVGPGAIVQNAYHLYEINMLTPGGRLLTDGVTLAQEEYYRTRVIARTSNFLGKSNWSTDALLKGDIAEVLIFNAGLSDADRFQVESYLMSKYALLAPPAAPSGLTASVGLNGQVHLTWNNPAYDPRNQVMVERRTGNGSWEQIAVLLLGESEFYDTTAQSGVAYSYRVRNANQAGYSDYTSEVQVAAPTLSILGGDDQASAPGGFAPAPLQAAVKDSVSGVPVAGFPVTFTVTQGDGLLSAGLNGTGPFVKSLTVVSNSSQGAATVYFQQPLASGATSTVTATAGVAGSVQFTLWTHQVVGFWRFNEEGGDAITDASENGNTGALVGGAVRVASFGPADQQADWQVPGGTALQLNGVDAAANVPDSSTLNFGDAAFSVSAWIKLDPSLSLADDSNIYPIVSKSGSTGTGFAFSLKGSAGNGVVFDILTGGVVVHEIAPLQSDASLLLDGRPHLLAFTRDAAGKGTLYIDGADVSTPAGGVGPDMSGTLNTPGDLWIGCDESGHFYKGILEDVKLVASAFMPAEIQAMFDRDNNGLPDWWEVRYLGVIGQDPNGDPDGDGATNAVELAQGSDPSDPTSVGAPLVRKTAGDGQTGPAGAFLAQPLEVTVTNSYGTPLPNAEVIFSVVSGGGQLAITSGATNLNTVLTVATDANGKAQIFYQQAVNGSVTSSISARTGLTPAVTFTVFTDSLVAYLKLNENTGWDAQDSSGAQNPGTIGSDGSIAWGIGFDGLAGLNVNGSAYSDQVGLEIDHTTNRVIPDTGGAFSISLWFKATALDTDKAYTLVTNVTPEPPGSNVVPESGFRVVLDGGLLGAGAPQLVFSSTEYGGTLHVPATTVLVTGHWYHLAVTYDGTTAQIYLDGVSAGSGTGTINGSPAPLRFASGIPDLQMLDGSLDEIKVFSKVLDPGEVTTLANTYGNMADLDGNGIPDGWEYRYFGMNGVNPLGDPSGTGLTNYNAWKLGLNPFRGGTTDTGGVLQLNVFTHLE
ncbi:LamG-like jellyroll fold domain-containing protein [Chthoniobacter flavus]|uniref:LamG-like jellyroll fold domain-containing protein n=2 Tax=Chthoniobacter flavus TaxID=191863 RepID=UPI001404C26F|nr:LamG-like jellyroll fold domain-containing protein [Chthoniobacter flavus]